MLMILKKHKINIVFVKTGHEQIDLLRKEDSQTYTNANDDLQSMTDIREQSNVD